MFITEYPLWQRTVGLFTGLILAATLGAPVLAASVPGDSGPAMYATRGPKAPVADFPRPAADAAGRGTAASVPPPAPAPTRPARTAKATRIPLRPGDVDILAHLVQAEAGDEPYAGKVAVAAVVINRIQSGRFPRTVYGVAFEQDAFESVSNGWYWNSPTRSAYAAARDALRGWDPSGRALFFFAPAKTANAFIWSRPIITQIGNHIFSR